METWNQTSYHPLYEPNTLMLNAWVMDAQLPLDSKALCRCSLCPWQSDLDEQILIAI